MSLISTTVNGALLHCLFSGGCEWDEVQCGEHVECIKASAICDGVMDCEHNEDEDGTMGICGGSGSGMGTGDGAGFGSIIIQHVKNIWIYNRGG